MTTTEEAVAAPPKAPERKAKPAAKAPRKKSGAEDPEVTEAAPAETITVETLEGVLEVAVGEELDALEQFLADELTASGIFENMVESNQREKLKAARSKAAEVLGAIGRNIRIEEPAEAVAELAGIAATTPDKPIVLKLAVANTTTNRAAVMGFMGSPLEIRAAQRSLFPVDDAPTGSVDIDTADLPFADADEPDEEPSLH